MSESGQNSRFRKESLEDSAITYFHKDLQKFIPRRLVPKVPRAEPIFSNWNISTNRLYWHRAHSFINRWWSVCLTVYLRRRRYFVQKNTIPNGIWTNTHRSILRWVISTVSRISWRWKPDFYNIQWNFWKKNTQKSWKCSASHFQRQTRSHRFILMKQSVSCRRNTIARFAILTIWSRKKRC